MVVNDLGGGRSGEAGNSRMADQVVAEIRAKGGKVSFRSRLSQLTLTTSVFHTLTAFTVRVSHCSPLIFCDK